MKEKERSRKLFSSPPEADPNPYASILIILSQALVTGMVLILEGIAQNTSRTCEGKQALIKIATAVDVNRSKYPLFTVQVRTMF